MGGALGFAGVTHERTDERGGGEGGGDPPDRGGASGGERGPRPGGSAAGVTARGTVGTGGAEGARAEQMGAGAAGWGNHLEVRARPTRADVLRPVAAGQPRLSLRIGPELL